MKRAAMSDSTESYALSLGGSVRCRTLPIETAPARFTATVFHEGKVLLVKNIRRLIQQTGRGQWAVR